MMTPYLLEQSDQTNLNVLRQTVKCEIGTF